MGVNYHWRCKLWTHSLNIIPNCVHYMLFQRSRGRAVMAYIRMCKRVSTKQQSFLGCIFAQNDYLAPKWRNWMNTKLACFDTSEKPEWESLRVNGRYDTKRTSRRRIYKRWLNSPRISIGIQWRQEPSHNSDCGIKTNHIHSYNKQTLE